MYINQMILYYIAILVLSYSNLLMWTKKQTYVNGPPTQDLGLCHLKKPIIIF